MINDNLLRIRERIVRASKGCGRDNDPITIVAVSKGRSVREIREAVDAGIFDIGENRVQEALLKYKQLSTDNCQLSAIKWHMVGHLQTNKVKDAVRIFDLIHSVDSLRLAEAIDKEAAGAGKLQDILIEVKTSAEAEKYGVAPEAAGQLLREACGFKNIRVCGLMTIAPLLDSPEKTRPYFRKLRQLRDRIYDLRITDYGLRVLSMGMSDDFEVAIEEGATMVRLGRAIFS